VNEPSDWIWETARDAGEIHALLCACDTFVATPTAKPPLRNVETTRRLVGEGATQVLRHQGGAVASFNLLWKAPFNESNARFPFASRPAFLGRLAVDPKWLERGAIVGAQCLRRAIDLALECGADALRAETNPDLVRMKALLDLFGFAEYGTACDPDGRRRVYLHLSLPQK
jgi:hypothetical protein